MPTGLVEEHDRVGAGDRLRDLGQVQAHGLARAARQHQAGGLALIGADRPEDGSGLGSLVPGG